MKNFIAYLLKRYIQVKGVTVKNKADVLDLLEAFTGKIKARTWDCKKDPVKSFNEFKKENLTNAFGTMLGTYLSDSIKLIGSRAQHIPCVFNDKVYHTRCDTVFVYGGTD